MRKATDIERRDEKRPARARRLLARFRRDAMVPASFQEPALPPHDFFELKVVRHRTGWASRAFKAAVHLTEPKAERFKRPACRRCLLERAIAIGRQP